MSAEPNTALTQTELSLDDLGRRVAERCQRINDQRLLTLENAAKTCDLVIAQGKDLLTAKARCKHGQWLEWLSKYFDRDERTAQRYMAAAVKNDSVSYLEDDRQAKQLFLIAELVPEPDGTETGGGDWKVSMPPEVEKLNWLISWQTKERDTILGWNESQRQEFKDRLRPLVELYAML